MDINANFRRQAELAAKILVLRNHDAEAIEAEGDAADLNLDQIAEYAEELANLFIAANEWLGKMKGALPDAWGARGICHACGSSCGCSHNWQPTELSEAQLDRARYDVAPRLPQSSPAQENVVEEITDLLDYPDEKPAEPDAITQLGEADTRAMILRYIAYAEEEIDHQEPDGSEAWVASMTEFISYCDEYQKRFGFHEEIQAQKTRIEKRRDAFPQMVRLLAQTPIPREREQLTLLDLLRFASDL